MTERTTRQPVYSSMRYRAVGLIAVALTAMTLGLGCGGSKGPEPAKPGQPAPATAAPGEPTPPVSATPPVKAAPHETAHVLRDRARSGPTVAAAAKETVVEVFYATDRLGHDRVQPTTTDYLRQFFPFGYTLVAVILLAALWHKLRSRPLPRVLRWLAVAVPMAMACLAILGCFTVADDAHRAGRVYGTDRGPFELGKCEVSIPPRHRLGEFESPSILRLEFRENPQKHIILLSVHSVPEQEFYGDLRNQMERVPGRDLFVFVHGYNVTFNDAARRAAQLAYDLPYTGVPVLFSWPSQGSVVEYTVDETCVEWSVPHLEQFLARLVHEFGAKRINLVAHSMGNRTLTSALRALEARHAVQEPFREIIMAAPDVDAQIFQRDIAPVVAKLGDRVTLYASSNDEALKASKGVHGSARAGDSGETIVVAPGIDTIDVSAVDMSILGHGYIGSNVTVLEDVYNLLSKKLPAEQRGWLAPTERDGLKYWVLQRTKLEEEAKRRGVLAAQ